MKGKSYMGHEPTPLFDAKMLEGKPITKFLNNRFGHNSQWNPPVTDSYIPNGASFKDLEFL
jgi:hypothetical protein